MSLLLIVFCLAILISNCRKTQGLPVMVAEPYCSDIKIVDARNIAGNLKVTKASFRNALSEICEAFTDVA